MYFFLVINKVGVNFISDPTQTPHTYRLRIFWSKSVKNRSKSNFLSTLPNQPTRGSSLCEFFFWLIIKRRISFQTPPRPPTYHTAYAFFGQNRTFFPQYQIRPLGGLTYINFFFRLIIERRILFLTLPRPPHILRTTDFYVFCVSSIF